MSCINQLVLESLIEEINLWSNPNRKLNLSNPDQAWSGLPGILRHHNHNNSSTSGHFHSRKDTCSDNT